MGSHKVRASTGIQKDIRFWLNTRRPRFLPNFSSMLDFVRSLCFELVKGKSWTPETI